MLGYIIVVAAVIWVFMYKAVLMQIWRDDLRYKLFALRDDLRTLRHEHPEQCPQELYLKVDEGIGRWINRLPLATLGFMYRAGREYQTNVQLREEVRRIDEALAACSPGGTPRIVQSASEVVRTAFICNSGAWLLPVIPLLVITVCVSWCAARIVRVARCLIVMRQEEVVRLSPQFAHAH